MPTTAPTFTPEPIPPLDAMRRAVLAERLHRLLDGGTPRPDSKYQRRELALHIGSAYEAQQQEVQVRNAERLQADYLTRTKLEKEWYFDDWRTQSEEGGTRDEFTLSFIATLHTDPATDTDFALLPDEFLTMRRYQNLPGEGIQDVRTLTRYDRRRVLFAPLVGSQSALAHDLFPGGLEGAYLYGRRNDRVVFEWDQGMQRPAQRWKEVELLLVIRRRTTDELPAPGLLAAAQDFDILARARKLVAGEPMEDKTNDNHENPLK